MFAVQGLLNYYSEWRINPDFGKCPLYVGVRRSGVVVKRGPTVCEFELHTYAGGVV